MRQSTYLTKLHALCRAAIKAAGDWGVDPTNKQITTAKTWHLNRQGILAIMADVRDVDVPEGIPDNKVRDIIRLLAAVTRLFYTSEKVANLIWTPLKPKEDREMIKADKSQATIFVDEEGRRIAKRECGINFDHIRRLKVAVQQFHTAFGADPGSDDEFVRCSSVQTTEDESPSMANRCVLEHGHPGQHVTRIGTHWGDEDETVDVAAARQRRRGPGRRHAQITQEGDTPPEENS